MAVALAGKRAKTRLSSVRRLRHASCYRGEASAETKPVWHRSRADERFKKKMKTIVTKTLNALAGLLLVVPFTLIALLFGGRAVTLAESLGNELLLVALAAGVALAGLLKGCGRSLRRVEASDELRLAAIIRAGS